MILGLIIRPLCNKPCYFWSSLLTGSGWKGLTAPGRAERELAESEVAEGAMVWGDWSAAMAPSMNQSSREMT